jgi:uncharacterized protein YceH (UPF0502 family)
MWTPLSLAEIRVLATLIEKHITTPEYYPMTLNALVNACNQKTNRDPVTNLSETEVIQAFDAAVKQGLARIVDEGASRVVKHRERLTEVLALNAAQRAILCELMLRGAQTAGELKSRAERMYKFASVAEVEATLNSLIARSTADEHGGTGEQHKPLVVRLPRQPGQKEARFMHLLAGELELTQAKNNAALADGTNDHAKRVEQLEAHVATLKHELDELRAEFLQFKRQFE